MSIQTKLLLPTLLLATGLGLGPSSYSRSFKSEPRREFENLIASATAPGPTRVPAVGDIEFAFSPGQGAEHLVLKAIESATKELRVMAYSFSSAPVTRALIDAHKRGVDVAVLADQKSNATEDRSGKARAALGSLATAGIHVRVIGVFPIHHDKVIVVDRMTTQTGSFNYSAAAAKSNSENVLVMWNNPAAADGYLRHWQHNWNLGTDWRPRF
jgi:phosphatidylserine/phosphatidylglycerophosphate/cardiolipin synthase-like enzyme